MKFIKNISTSKLVLMSGKIEIDIGGTTEVSDVMASSDDMLEAIRKGWVSITKNGKADAGGVTPEYNFVESEMVGTTEYPKETPKPTKKNKAETSVSAAA